MILELFYFNTLKPIKYVGVAGPAIFERKLQIPTSNTNFQKIKWYRKVYKGIQKMVYNGIQKR